MFENVKTINYHPIENSYNFLPTDLTSNENNSTDLTSNENNPINFKSKKYKLTDKDKIRYITCGKIFLSIFCNISSEKLILFSNSFSSYIMWCFILMDGDIKY